MVKKQSERRRPHLCDYRRELGVGVGAHAWRGSRGGACSSGGRAVLLGGAALLRSGAVLPAALLRHAAVPGDLGGRRLRSRLAAVPASRRVLRAPLRAQRNRRRGKPEEVSLAVSVLDVSR